MFRQSREEGMYLIGLLIVIAILGILTYGYFDKGAQGVSTYDASMGRAHAMECKANRAIFRNTVATWQIQNSNKTPSLEAMKKTIPTLVVPVCHDGGTITMAPSGELYCSVHEPDPATQPTPVPEGPTHFGS